MNYEKEKVKDFLSNKNYYKYLIDILPTYYKYFLKLVVPDELISEISKHYLSEKILDLISFDFEDVKQIPEKIEESKIFLKGVGDAIEKYVCSILKGAGIDPEEEIGADINLASDLLLKVLGGKNDS